MSKKEREVFGMLEKSETLFSIEDKIIKGTKVFESLNPFPGYYSEFPYDVKPVYLYVGMKEDYSMFDISRAHKKIENENKLKFEVAKATIKMHDRFCHVLRLRHLDRYDQVKTIQEGFKKEGLKPLSFSGKRENEEAHITLTKLFCIEKITDNIYMDCSEDYHAYLIIPRKLSWKEFEEVSKQVKYNWDESKFDVAIGSLFIGRELVEMVRIYSKKLTKGYLKDLRHLFLSKL
jgi:hypothetical protein